MKITALRPMLWTEDLPGTIDFYTNALGFECHDQNDEWGWASVSLDNVSIMLAKPNAHEKYDRMGFYGLILFHD